MFSGIPFFDSINEMTAENETANNNRIIVFFQNYETALFFKNAYNNGFKLIKVVIVV